MRSFRLLLVLASIYACGSSADTTQFKYKIESVHDGDTFSIRIESVPTIFEVMPVRVFGVDTPELNGKMPCEKERAEEAKQFTINFLNTHKDIRIENTQRDKYFRLLSEVKSGNISLSEELVKRRLGVPYLGGTKKKMNWCNAK